MQTWDPLFVEIMGKVKHGKSTNFEIQPDGMLMIGHRLCVLDVDKICLEK